MRGFYGETPELICCEFQIVIVAEGEFRRRIPAGDRRVQGRGKLFVSQCGLKFPHRPPSAAPSPRHADVRRRQSLAQHEESAERAKKTERIRAVGADAKMLTHPGSPPPRNNDGRPGAGASPDKPTHTIRSVAQDARSDR